MKKLAAAIMIVMGLWSCTKDNDKPTSFTYDLKGLSLSKDSLTNMITGETRKLLLAYTPAEATDKRVLWSSDNPAVARVDSGVVTAVSIGAAVITVESLENPDILATCKVTVTANSGITVTDLLLNTTVETITAVRGDGPRQFTYFCSVFGSLNNMVTITSSDTTVLDVRKEIVDGKPGFRIVQGSTAQGVGFIELRADAAPADVYKIIPFTVIAPEVRGVELSTTNEDEDGNVATLLGVSISGNITSGYAKKVGVVFTTNYNNIPTPTNKRIACVSSALSVATVDPTGTVDPATNLVSFKVYMNAAATVGQSATITLTTDDGGYEATYVVTAKRPAVKSVVLSQVVSRPTHAGDTIILNVSTIPSDPYDTTITWATANPAVANVALRPTRTQSVVKVEPHFVFNPNSPESTEINITATVDGVSTSCKLRPYQYVTPSGVLVTDQWGNRMRAVTATSGKATASLIYPQGTSAIPRPVDLYLTATPYPCAYPHIADPNQQFFWITNSNSKMYIQGSTYANSVNSDNDVTDAKVLAKTVTMVMGSGATSNATLLRVFVADTAETGEIKSEASNRLLFKCALFTNTSELSNAIADHASFPRSLSGTYAYYENPTNKMTNSYTPYTPPVATSNLTNDATPWPWPADGPWPRPSEGPAPTSLYQGAAY